MPCSFLVLTCYPFQYADQREKKRIGIIWLTSSMKYNGCIRHFINKQN